MGANTHVLLINGTQAKNVFWQVNGADSWSELLDFAGTMMTATAIAVGANSVFNGRATRKDWCDHHRTAISLLGAPRIGIDGGSAVSG